MDLSKHFQHTVMDRETRNKIIELASKYETADFIKCDPSRFMHDFADERDGEAAAFIASCLSYGQRRQFMPRIRDLLSKAGGEVRRWIVDETYEESVGNSDECFYRLHTCRDVSQTLRAYRSILTSYGDMKSLVAAHASNGREAVAVVCRYFAAQNASALVPKNDASACKRVCMFLRWMVRDGSPVDMGWWSRVVDKRTLVMPLDTHVLQEAQRLGLISTRTASMNAAVQLTKTMSEVFPDDPLRGDFALFGLGVDAENKR